MKLCADNSRGALRELGGTGRTHAAVFNGQVFIHLVLVATLLEC